MIDLLTILACVVVIVVSGIGIVRSARESKRQVGNYFWRYDK